MEAVAELLGWQFRRGVAFPTPVGELFKGVCRDSSAFSKTSFHLAVFLQPLWIRCDNVVLSFGGRLRNSRGAGFEVGLDSAEQIATLISEQAMPFLNSVQTPLQFAELSMSFGEKPKGAFVWQSDDVHALEASAYAYFLAGNLLRCKQSIQRLDDALRAHPDHRAWVKDLHRRTQEFAARLDHGEALALTAELADARLYTAQKLNIEFHLEG